MQKILVATPTGYVNNPYNFADGISIKRLPNILWDRAIVKGFIPEHERKGLQETEYWLCASGEVEHVYAAEAGDDLYAQARYAA